MKHPIIIVTTLNLLLAAAMPVVADEVNDHFGSNTWERVNARLNHFGDKIDQRHILIWLQ